MITILHLIPTLEGGGAERQLVMIASEQLKRGWKVHIALRRGGINNQILNTGVTIHNLGDFKSLNPRLFYSIAKVIIKIKPDIIQTWLPQMDIIGGILAAYYKTPWILSERNSKKAYSHLSFQTNIRVFLARNADFIIANSQQGADYWTKYLPKNRNIKVINNAVDINTIRNSKPLKPSQPTVQDDFILSIGRLIPSKAHHIVIKAASLLSNVLPFHTFIIGKGLLDQDLHEIVLANQLDNQITLLPYQSNWWGLLKYARVIISMSLYEGTPNVILEAMAAGCPIIVSDIPEHRAILNEKSALFIPVNDHQALANAIKLTIQDPIKTQERVNNASKTIENFTIETTFNAYAKVISTLLKVNIL